MPTTDTDTGTLAAGAYAIIPFNTSTGGNITVTLVSLSEAITVEIGLGIIVNGACTVEASSSGLAVGAQWMNSVSGGGSYCVELDDVATPNAPASLSYTLTIQHP